MAELPVVSGQQAAAVFEKDGWYLDRRKSSHLIYKKAGVKLSLSIPDHRSLDRGLLRRLIRDSGLSVDQFVELMK